MYDTVNLITTAELSIKRKRFLKLYLYSYLILIRLDCRSYGLVPNRLNFYICKTVSKDDRETDDDTDLAVYEYRLLSSYKVIDVTTAEIR